MKRVVIGGRSSRFKNVSSFIWKNYDDRGPQDNKSRRKTNLGLELKAITGTLSKTFEGGDSETAPVSKEKEGKNECKNNSLRAYLARDEETRLLKKRKLLGTSSL